MADDLESSARLVAALSHPPCDYHCTACTCNLHLDLCTHLSRLRHLLATINNSFLFDDCHADHLSEQLPDRFACCRVAHDTLFIAFTNTVDHSTRISILLPPNPTPYLHYWYSTSRNAYCSEPCPFLRLPLLHVRALSLETCIVYHTTLTLR